MAAKRIKKPALIPVPGKKPQMRKASPRSWSKARGSAFLSVLAETCNVSHACRVSGVPMTVAYRRRKMDAGFRAGWLDSIAQAYARLELVLLNRAFNGTEKLITRRDGSTERMIEYPNAIALKLLQMHRETAFEAVTELAADDLDEIRERLIRKLQRLKARDEAEKAGSQQLRSAGPDADADGRAGGGAAEGHP
jgi:hypothetical protein